MSEESMRVGLDNHPIKTNGWSSICEKNFGFKNRKKVEASLLLAESELIEQVKFEWVWVELEKYKKQDFLNLQNEPKLKVLADAKTILNISRERLCSRSSLERQQNWQHLLNLIAEIDPVLVMACVPECIYRGFCPKINPCQYIKTNVFKTRLELYRTLPNHV